MTVVVLIAAGLTFALCGRKVFGMWFNHVTVYSFVWAASLSLFELRFIEFIPLRPETWFLIAAAWACFLIGSFTVVAARGSPGRHDMPVAPPSSVSGRRLRQCLWALSLTAFAVAVYNWLVLIRLFGSVANVVILSNVVYTMRVANQIHGTIPYFDSFALGATLLAGIHTAREGRLTLPAFFSIATVVLIELGSMGRVKIIMAIILFLTGYFVTRRIIGKVRRRRRFTRVAAVAAVIVLLVTGAEFIRGNRGVYESFAGATTSLRRLQEWKILTPSVYLYLTVHHGVFNQYLMHGGEKGLVGGFTFAPVWRVLSKVGFDTEVPYYQQFYRTPATANTGTYLRELHADFGPAGVLFFPYFLGCIASWFWLRAVRRRRMLDMMVLGHLYVAVTCSIFVGVSYLGYWVVSFLASVAAGAIIDGARPRVRSAPAAPSPASLQA